MSGLADIAGVEALVVGDVMLDEYVWGSVDRISPEAPVPVVEVRERTRAPGGAANAAAGVVALGSRAGLVGVIGADEPADGLRAALSGSGVEGDDLVVDAGRATTVKTRVIAHAQQVVRTDFESPDPLAGRVEEEVTAVVRERMSSAGVLILSDYGKGVVTEGVAAAAIAAARERNRPIVVDSKGTDYGRYRGATVLTPNVHDAGRAANLRIESDSDLREAATRLAELTDGAAILITRGAAGMSLFWSGEPLHIPTEAREVYDVTGAGDTVVAVLGAALGAGLELPEAVRLANAAAGVVVGKVGTSTVALDEIEERASGA